MKLSNPKLAILLATVMLASAAIYNGYPFIYYDTKAYLFSGFRTEAHWSRPIFYGLVLRVLTLGVTLWTVMLAQSLAMAHLLWLSVRTTLKNPRPTDYLAVVAILSLATSLPWVVGLILPDVSTPILVLSIYVLGFGDLGSWERRYLFALAVLACVTHLSNPPLVMCAFAVFGLCGWLKWIHFRPSLIAFKIGVTSFLVLLGHNYLAYGPTRITGYGSVPLFARWYADGPAERALRSRCVERKLRLCALLDNHLERSDQLLWSARGISSVGGAEMIVDEANEVVRSTLRREPARLFGWAMRNGLTQLLSIRTGNGMIAYSPNDPILGEYSTRIADLLPRDRDRLYESRQQRSQIWFEALNWLHVPVAFGSMILCIPLILRLHSRRKIRAAAFAFWVLTSLIANATITGALSEIHARYQSRCVWLATFAAMLGLLSLRRTTEKSEETQT